MKYTTPEIEIVKFEAMEVIVASTGENKDPITDGEEGLV